MILNTQFSGFIFLGEICKTHLYNWAGASRDVACNVSTMVPKVLIDVSTAISYQCVPKRYL